MACSCSVSLGNSGTPGFQPINKVAKKIIVVPYYDNAGTVNYIDLSATLNAAYVSGKINQSDKSKRWYPLPEVKNVVEEKADSVFETFEDGTRAFIREGERTFTGLMPNQSPNFLGKIKDYKCSEIGIFVVDKDGNLIGSKTVAGYLYPIKLEQASWDAKLMKATDAAVQKVQLSFQYGIDELDENLNQILACEWSGINLLGVEGLIDVYATFTSTGQTAQVVKLYTDYGSAKNPLVAKGFVLADFTLYNVTDSGAVTITSVTESPDGTYTLAYASQTLADLLRLTVSKNGYDGSTIDDTNQTVA